VKPEGWRGEKPIYCEPQWVPSSTPARVSPKTGHYGDVYE
jgi:hypothetical protein